MARTKRKGKRSNATAGQRGIDRQKHFEAGGSPVEYRGGPSGYQKNKKDKRETRRTRKQKAIQDSQE